MDIREQLGNIRNELQKIRQHNTIRDGKGNVHCTEKELLNVTESLDKVLTVMDHEEERLREVVGNKELSEHELAMIALMVKDMIR